MSGQSFVRRYWLSLLGAWPRAELVPAEGSSEGYGFWRRYWASLLGVTLPLRPGAGQVGPSSVPDAVSLPVQPPMASQPDNRIFPLPLLPSRAAVAAASSADLVVLKSPSPDGRVEFILHRMGTAEPSYSLEIILRVSDVLPLVVLVRYGNSIENREQQIIIPITHAPLGPASSMVRLPGFDPGLPWGASSAIPPDEVLLWEPAVVAFSVRAAATENTDQAWREVARLVTAGIRRVIEAGFR